MNENEMVEFLRKVKSNLRVTKVVATRSVKGKDGDHFAGFSACYDSVQDEPAGMGKDLISDEVPSTQGMSMKEAKVAFYLLALQADVSAHEAALASGHIGAQQASDMIRALRSNFGKLIRRELSVQGDGGGDAPTK